MADVLQAAQASPVAEVLQPLAPVQVGAPPPEGSVLTQIPQAPSPVVPAAPAADPVVGVVGLMEDPAAQKGALAGKGVDKKLAGPLEKGKGGARGSGERCKHGNFRSRCRECLGATLCVHSKRRCECAECGGSALCVHNRRKYSCKECGGSQFCSHNKIKRR